MALLKLDPQMIITDSWSDDEPDNKPKPLGVLQPKLCSGFGQFHSNEKTNDPDKQKTRKPYADITFNEIKRMVDNPDRVDKPSSQWLIPSTLKSRTFAEQEKNGKYWLLWLDFDDNPPPIRTIKKHLIDIVGDADFEIYNTSSATEDNQKCRVLIPLHQWLKFEDWTRCQQILNDKFEELGIIPDRANQRAAQLCYLPNRGRFYHSISQRNNNFLNPLERFKDEFLAIERVQKAEKERSEAMRKVAQEKRASLQYDGSDNGLIDAFNQAYTVEEILLRNCYKKQGLKFCHPDSTTGNYAAAINPETGRVHTLSTKDPLYVEGGHSGHDAFSCFEILEHGGNRSAALSDAGDNHLTIDGESWNTVKRREYMQAQKQPAILQTVSKKKNDAPIPPNADIGKLFLSMALNSKVIKDMAEAVFLIDNVIVKGHFQVFAAKANGGKSALFRYFCEELAQKDLSVIYVNVDASASDLKKHYFHAEEHRYMVVAPDAHVGRSADDVLNELTKIANSGVDLNKYVFIIDTLKKFTDVINKSRSKELYNLFRKLTVKGGTICCLAHCNKYNDDNGQAIFEGTADLRNDADELIYLDSSLNESTNILEVTTRPDKVRADFSPVSFEIDRNNNLKVTPCDSVKAILPPDDRQFIEIVKDAIKSGIDSQSGIVEIVTEKMEWGAKKARGKLKHFTHEGFFVEKKTGIKKGLKYEIME